MIPKNRPWLRLIDKFADVCACECVYACMCVFVRERERDKLILHLGEETDAAVLPHYAKDRIHKHTHPHIYTHTHRIIHKYIQTQKYNTQLHKHTPTDSYTNIQMYIHMCIYVHIQSSCHGNLLDYLFLAWILLFYSFIISSLNEKNYII